LLVTIHRRIENCRLGIAFVHKWLRKRPYAFYESCRVIRGLQLSIIHLVHFCSKISSLDISNRAKSNSIGWQRHAFAPTRNVVLVATPGRTAGRPGTTAGAPLRSPVPRPPTDVHTQPSVATRTRSRAVRNPPAPPSQRRCRRTPAPRAHLTAIPTAHALTHVVSTRLP
jgi:hypothetical protein